MATLAKILLSPAQKQYRRFKATYPGFVLLFRMGDFYELVWDDAQLAASVLGLALTTRNAGSPAAVAMSGIPLHALEDSLRKI
jgi:DNA mismatch repair protein MutS